MRNKPRQAKFAAGESTIVLTLINCGNEKQKPKVVDSVPQPAGSNLFFTRQNRFEPNLFFIRATVGRIASGIGKPESVLFQRLRSGCPSSFSSCLILISRSSILSLSVEDGLCRRALSACRRAVCVSPPRKENSAAA